MTVLILLTVLPFLFLIGIGLILSGPKYTGPVTDHFNGKQFTNPTGIKSKGLGDVLRWMLQRKPGDWTEDTEIPFGKPTTASDELRITYVNHSTFLIQVGSINILTDPVWSDVPVRFHSQAPEECDLRELNWKIFRRLISSC